jgi:hypothetical protein
MKIAIACSVLLLTATSASAQYYGQRNNTFGGYGTGSNSQNHFSSGYTTNSGTYVQPHYQTNPNHTQYDNYGTIGNQNPYTGAYGTHRPRY